ncbi:MAG: hypothetical protein QF738_11440 [Rhodospirillales bacterium]|nr:hypothetical protein [Rhodospirillales bacterium]
MNRSPATCPKCDTVRTPGRSSKPRREAGARPAPRRRSRKRKRERSTKGKRFPWATTRLATRRTTRTRTATRRTTRTRNSRAIRTAPDVPRCPWGARGGAFFLARCRFGPIISGL